MQRALDAARQSLYITSPNPRVGCVIEHKGQVIATGATQMAGGPHAEVMALAQAAQAGYTQLHEATVYVTLEPCSHYGRTPPCVDALIQARPRCVVIAMLDPNPQVAGQGVAKLRAAGIEVVLGVETDQALALNVGFVARMVRGRPWLWLKTASSLDGRTALPDGQSKWITGLAARLDGQHFRARSCVVLSGIGTVLDDDPLLNVRDLDTPRQPVRAIVDSQLRISPQAKLFNGDPVWLFTVVDDPVRAQSFNNKNARIIVLPPDANGRVSLSGVMQWLAEQQINEVHVEAGAVLNGALLQAGYVDALLSYIAPMVIGPGRPLLQLPELKSLDHASRFEITHSNIIGKDVRLLMRQVQHWQHLYQHIQQLQT